VANVEDAESSNAVHVRLRELDDTYGGASRDRTGDLLHAMKHITHCKLLITMRANHSLFQHGMSLSGVRDSSMG